MNLKPERILWVIGVMAFLIGCRSDKSSEETAPPLFQLLDPKQTNVSFKNELPEDEFTNPLVYEYTYNGGGVAVGDVNGDGRDDVYFTANKGANKLYLNQTKPDKNQRIQFDDVTDAAGVADAENWKTGVTMADVNGDGKLDIYVCHSGNLSPEKRTNKLFINLGNTADGKPRFTEEAARFGLADSAFSTQAAFFDYDHDQDLDMLLVNHSPRRFENLDDSGIAKMMQTPDALTGVKLYRNDNNQFHESTQAAGLRNTRLSYGLGVSVADLNNDGWPDIYLSNDYLAPDYLYINQSGRFSDQTEERLGHTSQFSMGNDVADVNNDGWSDILTLDMLPEDNRRQKLLFANDNYELFALRERVGLHKQYMRNMLHLNPGLPEKPSSGKPSSHPFAEVGQLAGISNTDWSWAPLMADFDNDGWKDLFITNGYVHDYTNMDFLKFMGDYVRARQGNIQRSNLLELVRQMPSSNVVNYAFRNNGGKTGIPTFTNQREAWGITEPSNSNGAAYADLDNDGDLDLIVNNINAPAFIYQNQAEKQIKHNVLTVKLQGKGRNTFGVGASVRLYSNGQIQKQEQLLCRGFQSSVSPTLHFGLGREQTADSLLITWPTGRQQRLRSVKANQTLVLREADATKPTGETKFETTPVFISITPPVAVTHIENEVNDFKRQPLMVNSLSYSGPCLAKGDINGDGREDLFMGGTSGHAGHVFLQQSTGKFVDSSQPVLQSDYLHEDADAAFVDVDRDGDLDLYVCSGGYDNFLPNDALLQDRLYLNDGRGHFSAQAEALPRMYTSTSCVRVADINGDGFPDLFVGGRVVPARYPESPESYVLMNDGHGKFTDQTQRIAPALKRLGMITDAAWADLNGDRRPDLITAGEWLPVQVWINQPNGKFQEQTNRYLPRRASGWWNRLLVTDLNKDGRPDIVAGNMGLNTQCRASEQQPAELYAKDFDGNGAVDPILCMFIQNKSYPFVTRDELLDQISLMRPRFTDYKSYADTRLTDVFTSDELAGAQVLRANCLQTTVFISQPNGRYFERALPLEAQTTPIYAMTTLDYDRDGHLDLLLGGNISHSRVRFGNNDASGGLLLKGDGTGKFRPVPMSRSGLTIRGDIRSFAQLNRTLLVGRNSRPLIAYTY